MRKPVEVTKEDLILMAEQRRKLHTNTGAKLATFASISNGKTIAHIGNVLRRDGRDTAVVVMEMAYSEAGVRFWVINVNAETGEPQNGGSCTWINGSDIENYNFVAKDYAYFLDSLEMRELKQQLCVAEKALEEARMEVEEKSLEVLALREQIYR
jgi:hypothetical protein